MSIARRLISVTGGELEAFVFRIVTTSSNQVFELPIADYGSITPDFSVDWDDGSSNTITSSSDVNRIHTFTSPGTYDISLTGTIPSFKVNNSAYRGLYTAVLAWGTASFRTLNFYGCSNLTSLPSSGGSAIGNDGLNTLVNVDNFLRATGITTLPTGLMDYMVNVTSFVDSFSFMQISSIPSGFFDNCTNALSFNSTFNQCFNLTAIPSGLFDNNTNVTNFSSTFKSCISIGSIPTGLFDNNTNVTTFFSVFRMPTPANSLTGNAPELWTRDPEPLGLYAFRNCTGLTNFASIPVNWR
jgi:hypothetical protein